MFCNPPDFSFEKSCDDPVAGVDEAGRGPLAGPVVAAAVILNPRDIPDGISDSKSLSEKRRTRIAAAIYEKAHVGVGSACVDEIDKLNILQATLLAMARAVANLPATPRACLVDGNCLPALPMPAHAIVKGDMRSLSIAAASIIAKTQRDAMMIELGVHFPEFGWAQNKGYSARAHLKALSRLGPTIHHRRSFAPVRLALEQR